MGVDRQLGIAMASVFYLEGNHHIVTLFDIS
jgi:hypothetical protein